jgi:penicillin-binding protein 2
MEFIHEIFPDTLRGAVVLLDVEDGGILALYSAPSFDPNLFVGGISAERYRELDLFNRATMGTYPPASTWKVATAAIALELGVVSPDEMMPSSCTGSFFYGNRIWHCHLASGHGHLDLSGALAKSCNVYFYQLGLKVGLERLVAEANRLGFDEPCGVDLPRESDGSFPESLDYWQRSYGNRPNETEVLSLSIGQGPNSQSPLKMAQFYLALGRGGSAPAPRLARLAEGEEPEISWTLNLSEENLEAILDGLRAVTAPGGTAYMSSLEHWDLIGKTGTAQQGIAGSPTHAWFTGLAGRWEAPPEVAVAVIVEEAGGGSSIAAPIAAKAVDFYLRRKYGIPTTEVQTLREHYSAGVPAPWAR